MFVRRHGNWRHGRYTKQSPADRLHFRWAIAVLSGRWNGPPPGLDSKPAPGWAAYPHRPQRDAPAVAAPIIEAAVQDDAADADAEPPLIVTWADGTRAG